MVNIWTIPATSIAPPNCEKSPGRIVQMARLLRITIALLIGMATRYRRSGALVNWLGWLIASGLNDWDSGQEETLASGHARYLGECL